MKLGMPRRAKIRLHITENNKVFCNIRRRFVDVRDTCMSCEQLFGISTMEKRLNCKNGVR